MRETVCDCANSPEDEDWTLLIVQLVQVHQETPVPNPKMATLVYELYRDVFKLIFRQLKSRFDFRSLFLLIDSDKEALNFLREPLRDLFHDLQITL